MFMRENRKKNGAPQPEATASADASKKTQRGKNVMHYGKFSSY
jgi:hypothetical protein